MATHQNNDETYSQVYTDLAGVQTVTTVHISNVALTNLTVTFVSPMSSGWLIKTATYSYDGILHTESYISDL